MHSVNRRNQVVVDFYACNERFSAVTRNGKIQIVGASFCNLNASRPTDVNYSIAADFNGRRIAVPGGRFARFGLICTASDKGFCSPSKRRIKTSARFSGECSTQVGR